MNADAPRTPREELEIQITALLMGQLSSEDASKVEAQIAGDPELIALRDRLQHAANLLREARALPDAAPSGEPMRLSSERREKLLATFRGIKALPSANPNAAAHQMAPARRKRAWAKPMILAASIAVLLTGGVFLFSGHFAPEHFATERMASRGSVPDHSLMEFTAEADYAPPSTAPVPHISLSRGNSVATPGLSEESKRHAMNWSAQAGAVRAPAETPANPSLDVITTTSSRPSLGSGQSVPQLVSRSYSQRPLATTTGGVYLPRTDADGEQTVEFLAKTPAAGISGVPTQGSYFGNNRPEAQAAERFDTFSDASKLDAKHVNDRMAGKAPEDVAKLRSGNRMSETAARDEAELDGGAGSLGQPRSATAATGSAPHQPFSAAPVATAAEAEGRVLAETTKPAEVATQLWDVTTNWSRPLALKDGKANAYFWSAQVDPAAPHPNDLAQGLKEPAAAEGSKALGAVNGPVDPANIADGLSVVSRATAVRAKEQAPTPATAPAEVADLPDTPLAVAPMRARQNPTDLEGNLARPGTVDFDVGGTIPADGTDVSNPALKTDLHLAELKPQPAKGPGIDAVQQQFVDAFLAVRKAEEKAAAGDSKTALEGFQNAAKSLEQIKQQWPKWQPELVEYRLKRTQQFISATAEKAQAKEGEAAKASAPVAEEPATPVPAPVPPPVPQPEVSTTENAFSTFSLNVSDVSYQLAAATLDKGQMPEAGTIRSEEFINAFNYRDPEPAPGSPFAFATERARYPFAHNRDLLRLSLKTAAAGREAGRPLNLVLVIDNSGSMERADRVTIMKEALRVLTAQLKPEDKLSLITFSRAPRLWANGVAGDKAAEFTQRVGEMTPEGGTDLSAALDLGYQTALRHYGVGSMNRVVLLTDGAANLGDVKADALKAKVEKHRQQGVAFDCFGVGWEDYNDDLLEQLSRNGDGRYGFINSPEAAAKDFAGQLAGALRPAAADVKVQVEFNPSRVVNYRQIGYAKHQLMKEQFRDNTVDASELAAAESGNALYTVEVNPRGDGDIATVRARFKVPGTTEYQEHAWTVPYQAPAPALEQSSSSLRLAATAAAFSEMLAHSPHAAEVTSDRLLRLISGIPAIYGVDPRPAKLEGMIRQAKSLSGR